MRIKEKAIFLMENLLQFKSLPDFERVYIGDEFCERRLPSISAFQNIYNQCNEKNLKLTLATPYVTNKGIKKIEQLLDFIAKNFLNLDEVVINDWGVLKLLKNYNDKFRIILGRILVSRYFTEHCLKRRGEAILQKNEFRKFYCLFPDTSLEFIKAQNISCLEFNSCRHLAVTQEQVSEYGFKMHIYFPFLYLTTTRYCSSINGFSSYFRDAIKRCNKECEKYFAIMTDRHIAHKIFIKGNTHFFMEQEERLENFNLDVDRLIYNDFMKV